MFTKMQKYQKGFLVVFTVLLTASFGMGTVFFYIFNPENVEQAGTIGRYNMSFSIRQFNNFASSWSQLHGIARRVSRKANVMLRDQGRVKESQELLGFASEATASREIIEQLEQEIKQYQFLRQFPQYKQQIERSENYLGYLQSRIYAMETPIWDSIFSLHSLVAEIDAQLDKPLKDHPNAEEIKELENTIWNYFQQSRLDVSRERVHQTACYLYLSEDQRLTLSRNLKNSEIWNRLMLLEEAKRAGIQVTELEIDEVIANTEKIANVLFSDESNPYNSLLKEENVYHSDFRNMLRDALTILKLIHAEYGGVRVAAEDVHKQAEQGKIQKKFRYVRFSAGDHTKEVDYQKERLAFFDEKTATSYFTIPASADFEYIYVANSAFTSRVKVSPEERQELQEQQQGNENIEDKVNALKDSKAKQRAYDLMASIHARIQAARLVPWSTIASQYDLSYESESGITTEDFGNLGEVATDAAKKAVYEELQVGETSSVLSTDKGYFIIRLLKLESAKQLTREEIAQNEEAFLLRVYHQNKKKFILPERYRLGFVLVDFETIREKLVPTTNMLKDFYEEYKENLYKIENKSDTDSDKEGEEESASVQVSYRPFAEVKKDVESRCIHLLRIRELEKIRSIHRGCLKLGKGANVKLVVEGLAKKAMYVSDALQYKETELLTREQLLAKNPSGDANFTFSPDEKEISPVRNSPNGMYFFLVLATEKEEKQTFAQCQDEVREYFLRQRALSLAKKRAAQCRQEYLATYRSTQKQIDAHYQNNPKERVRRQKELAAELLKALASKWQVSYEETSWVADLTGVQQLKNTQKLAAAVEKLKPGEISAVTEEVDLETVFLVQLAEAQDKPDLAMKKLLRVRQNIQEQRRRAFIYQLLNHDSLMKKMGLEKTTKGTDYEDA